MTDFPKLQPSTDAEWRAYYETKCRELTELCRRSHGVIECYLGGQRPNVYDVLLLVAELDAAIAEPTRD